MAKVEIIATGNELIKGQLENTTTLFLRDQFLSIGYEVIRFVTIGDDKDQIKEAIREALSRADIVVITGGLGSTPDDLTREALAEAVDRPLEFRTELWSAIQSYYRIRGRKAPATSIKQVYLPYGAQAIPNFLGTTPGIILPQESQTIIVLPGSPGELRQMFFDLVKPYFESRYLPSFTWKRFTFKVCGLEKSAIIERLKEVIDEIKNTEIQINFLTKPGEVHVILGLHSQNEEEMNFFFYIVDKIKSLLGSDLYGTDGENLPGKVGELLRKQNLTLGVAESCTGGLIGNYITNITGSSDYFRGGIIVYTNKVKEKILGVSSRALSLASAVNPEAALEMAQGVCRVLESNLGLATTGFAGPNGGLPDKPVGTVYLGLATPSGAYVKKLFFPGLSRITIKTLAAKGALDFLRRYLINPSEVG